MSYNLKNQSIVVIAVVFAVMMTFAQVGLAQVEETPASAEVTNPQSEDITSDLFGLEQNDAQETEALPEEELVTTQPLEEDIITSQDAELSEPVVVDDVPAQEVTTSETDDLFADETAGEDDVFGVETDDNAQQDEESAGTETENTDPFANDGIDNESTNLDLDNLSAEEQSSEDETLDNTEEAPKSPFENFGNAILSKVDNSLFNQMSNIEKQTTLLNLEYKREEVRNRVEALRMQREKAKEEAKQRKLEEEQRLKDEETQRKIKEMEAQAELRKIEMELEKVRQARVVNEYMNQMLMVNQEWVEKNAQLQNQVKTLRDERRTLIKDFEGKIIAVNRETTSTLQKAEAAKEAHDKSVKALESQISSLRRALADSEKVIKQLREGSEVSATGNTADQFADLAAVGIDENAIDMSDEYAIMDITGKGREIVAKILNKEGTTFIVHKGSMLKGGEVVTAITDNYVAFDNNGVKSYLYTGGTVREYEPDKSFNNADKTPIAASGVVGQNKVVRNVRGATVPNSATPTSASEPAENNAPVSGSRKTRTTRHYSSGGSSSLSGGMFVK